MICRTCGTEIADKALICYRCGNATFEPSTRERQGRRRSVNLLPSLVALVVLALGALLMGLAPVGAVPQEVSIVLAALASVVLAVQLFRRRRR